MCTELATPHTKGENESESNKLADSDKQTNQDYPAGTFYFVR